MIARMEREFSIFRIIGEWLGLDFSGYLHVLGSLIVVLFLSISALLVWRKWRDPQNFIIPSPYFSAGHFYDIFCNSVLNILNAVIGEKSEKYLPLIGTLFLYLLSCNLFGAIPLFSSPTTNINTNLPCAAIVFFYYNYVGIRERGFVGYFKEMAGPVVWLAPLIFAVELVSHVVRPMTLSLRLYGNMVGDHLVLQMFTNIAPIIVPIFAIALDVVTGLIQAFVFCMLSIIYISLAGSRH